MAYSDCLTIEEVHHCVRCPEDQETEFAGVGSAGYIKKSYLATILATPTTLATWETGVTNGDVIVLPETRGTFEPGDPKENKGYGRTKISYGARTMVLALVEKFDKDNYAFWNTIQQRSDLVPFFLTSSLIHIFDTVAVVKGGYAVGEDVEEVLEWSFTATVTSGNLPTLHSIATIATVFECPAATTTPGALAISTQPTNQSGADGSTVTFAIAATGGTAPRNFQLQKLVSGTWTNVGSATTSAPTITGATAANNGSYRILVTDSAATPATVISSTITLTVAEAGGGTTYDSVFNFDTESQPNPDGGAGNTFVGLNSGQTDDNKKFEFDRIASPTGAGTVMTIKVGGATELVVSYSGNATPAGYGGQPFRYTDAANVVHTTFLNGNPAVFTAGIVNF